MPCTRPVTAYQLETGEVIFAARGKVSRELELPCGQCMDCRLSRQRDWAIRCFHEMKLHPENIFITLTYDNEHLPSNGSLDYRDFQLFAKRLRKSLLGGAVRFFMCGEYGERLSRPHYHAILFGYFPSDAKPHGESAFGSDKLAKLWGKGYVHFTRADYGTAQYVAGYVTKKVTGKNAADHYQLLDQETGEIHQVTPEFCRMSLKPGIGKPWFDRFHRDYFPADSVIVNGKELPVPKYYNRLLEQLDGDTFEHVQHKRYLKGMTHYKNRDSARLRARELITRARQSTKKRNLESLP